MLYVDSFNQKDSFSRLLATHVFWISMIIFLAFNYLLELTRNSSQFLVKTADFLVEIFGKSITHWLY
jgi:hypothetical protein